MNRRHGWYHVFGGGDFKRGEIGLSGSACLSEATSGESVESPFRRVSSTAMPSSSAHAESDWLESSAANQLCPTRL